MIVNDYTLWNSTKSTVFKILFSIIEIHCIALTVEPPLHQSKWCTCCSYTLHQQCWIVIWRESKGLTFLNEYRCDGYILFKKGAAYGYSIQRTIYLLCCHAPLPHTHIQKMLCTRFSLIHKGRFLDCLRHLLWLHNSQETHNTKQKYWLNSDL